ncbi:MAG: di-trans,poly-cis-decaprenylcistransferase [Gemmatimonadaceae bacterium]|nr:di-trans,poly-cis-decaprenylcistransferase [Gemmatimonadaceae bacterium]
MEQSAFTVPAHVALIMDGNGRWAERRGHPRWWGHVAGARTVRTVVEHCARRGVAQLTLYAFSADNWQRPTHEVETLFRLFAHHINRQSQRLARHGIRCSVIGRRDRLPLALRGAIADVERRTAAGRRLQLNVALDYSSRAAIQEAMPVHAAVRGVTRGATILPPVDLLVRTGGERRLSDFLLWECAYAELLFLDCLWPDVTAATLDAAFEDFARRDRRFGALPSRASA